jgi:hypothetical protein
VRKRKAAEVAQKQEEVVAEGRALISHILKRHRSFYDLLKVRPGALACMSLLPATRLTWAFSLTPMLERVRLDTHTRVSSPSAILKHVQCSRAARDYCVLHADPGECKHRCYQARAQADVI